MEQFRQGDVLLVKVASIPDGFKSRKGGKVILAYGEVSGHHHRFECGNVTAFFKEGDDLTMSGGGTSLRGSRTDVEYISVPKAGASLVHEEHDAISVGEGAYRVIRQREFDLLEGVRRVAD